jgi:predicted RNase H-like HicB family nuclease
MATTNNSKSFFDLSVTTQLFLLVGFLWKVQLLLIFNPLTLFVLNIFKPRWARTMAHSDALYDKKSQEFFTEQAKEWPWHWAKWWYTREELKELSVERQLDYYYDVDDSVKTLAAMSRKAAFRVIDDGLGNNFEGLKKNINEIKMSPELFRVFIRKSFKDDDMSVLSDYLKRGTLSKELVECLADEARESTTGIYSNTWLALVFYDYVERCGLGQDLLKTLFERPNSAHFKKEVERRQNIYSQRVFTKSQRGSKQIDAWISFCETTKEICPQAQMEMGLDQYHVFHETGHTLDAEAILHILKHYSNLTMAQLIFKYEPNYGMANDDIKEFVNNNPTLQDLLNAVICSCQDFLSKSIKAGERLDISFVIKMFECPKAEEFVMKYIKKHSLPNTIHDKLLSLDNAKEVIQLYVELYDNDEFTELDLDVRREAERRGWIPEKKD